MESTIHTRSSRRLTNPLPEPPNIIGDGAPERFELWVSWELTGETKNIGIYTCYKALFEKEEDTIELDFVDGEIQEINKTKKTTVIAWYTPNIPISNGPGNYGGLPGLILEVNDDGLTIVCTEVVLNPSETIVIKAPSKGKQVTQKKFEEISIEKSKELMNRFRSRDGGSAFEIQIGG